MTDANDAASTASATDANASADSPNGATDTEASGADDDDDVTVTPYAVEGDVDYGKLLERFGADRLTDEQVERFPDHPLLRRGIYYAGRDVDPFLDAAAAGETHSIVTGRGPSGPMHLGHVMPFYLAKRLQDETGAHVFVPLSDDEKYLLKEQSSEEIREHARDNLRDLLAVGFDPERTRFVIDGPDADAVYPTATRVAKRITPATVEATYGEPPNVGLSFYPAVQATHLLLPQLLHGPHPTLVPVAVDQDPHVRVCRDVADREAFDVRKPGALLGKFLPSLEGPGKMSSSADAPGIELTDDPEDAREKIMQYAYSGGRVDVEEHREHGGDPEVDVAYQLLYYFLEPDDERVERLAREYREGELLSGELKQLAADRLAEFLRDHQRRRDALGPLAEELAPYRLTDEERRQLRSAVV
ncbi:tryptophan--tRNA ligase [Halomicrobium salinisoli]|uniref:tryptophan--tRNA ligase n=1 Tax=Halomicrobium salinisoli TaxID=2878391 RepID=UPI001CF01660|nr:tryptophan--tRNA ligase [Halomicrobium salinisoli]